LIAFDDSPARGLEERLPLQNLDGTTLPDCSSALPLSDNINSENFNRTVIANAQELGFSEPRSPLGTADIDSLVLMSVKLWPPPVSTVVSHYVLVVKSSSAYQHQLATTLQERLQNKPGVTCELRWFDTDTITDSGLIYVFLLELEDSILETISAEQFSLLQGTLVSANRLIWLTAQHESSVIHPSRAMMDGLARVLRVENDAAVIVTASIERASFEKQAESITTIIGQTNFNSNNNDYEQAYVQRNGIFEIARVKPSKTLSQQASENAREYQSKVQPFGAGPPLEMTMATPGLLDSLHFVEDCSVSEALAPDEVEIQVQMVGLNFKDLLLALGRINGTSLGNECSGIITRAGQNTTHKIGDRVCVLVPTAFRTYTRAKGNAVAIIPDSISLADAASIPTQFITAYYAINSMAKLEKGESILIHSGAGGTGQAAIQIAQYLGAEIYTTVSSEEKKRFLKSEYSIPEDHVFYSRDTSFADGISRMTNGRGIDVIINSLAGDSLMASWNSIAPYGRFIEIGRKDLDANSNLPMRPFLRSATFAALETSKLSIDNPARVREACDQILQMFVDGTLHPVRPFRIMPISDVQKGMRMLQEGKNMGKIVFEMTPEALVPVSWFTTNALSR
jgi:NADPH:quinone reductase-like Zn-dependent oxidoreductase